MFSHFRRFFKTLGPGFVTGASDDDPSGIATYAQAGAGFGFTTLWAILFTIPLMIAVQEMAARIALVTSKGLMSNIHARYPRILVVMVAVLLLGANIINIGADLGMMASALQSLLPVSFGWLLAAIAIVTLVLQIFLSYATYAKYLKWLTLSLFSYVLVSFVMHVEWFTAFRATVWPHLSWSPSYLLIFVALLGTTISPYLYFWQANQEVEEERRLGRRRATPADIKRMRWDVGFGMVFSNIIAWFIILATATALFGTGYVEITSADQAAKALAPLVGSFASVLFALGIIGTGLLTIPILSSTAAYATCELVGVAEGLSKKWWQAKTFYGVIIVSTVIGILLNFVGINPVRALIYSAVCNAIAAPPVLLMILLLACNKKVMGQHVNGRGSNIFGWITFLVMAAAPITWLILSRF